MCQAFCDRIASSAATGLNLDRCRVDFSSLAAALGKSRLPAIKVSTADYRYKDVYDISPFLSILAQALPRMPIEILDLGGMRDAFLYARDYVCEGFTALLESAAECSTLQVLTLPPVSYSDRIDQAVDRCLASKAMRRLSISNISNPKPLFREVAPKHKAPKLWEALKLNYHIQDVRLGVHDLPHHFFMSGNEYYNDVWDADLLANVEMVTRLNRAGRSYMALENKDRSMGHAVLAQVNDSLDCLFFHLQENPVLVSAHASRESK